MKNELLRSHVERVEEFHRIYKLGIEKSPTAALAESEYLLRYKLMREENEEYLEACQNGDLAGIADALGDMMYILFGTIVRHGLQEKIEDVFREIHQSNLSKLDEAGNPIYREDGKVMKGPNYFPPDIRKVLEI